MSKIISLNIGTSAGLCSSVGYCVIDRESKKVLESGTNAFPEGTPDRNQERRSFRSNRRMKRRLKTRIKDFKKLWKDSGFSIPETFNKNVLDLKNKAIIEQVTLDEMYMILYNYLKHRGISYLDDVEDDNSVNGSSEYSKALQLNEEELKSKYPCQIQKERLEKVNKYRGSTRTVGENGESVIQINTFTTSAYLKEINAILKQQRQFHKELTNEFCEGFLTIFNRKRKFYEGPGNEKSRTDYGKYTTKKDASGNYITEKNIFEKLIGHCSIHKDKLKAASASYTAQEFNILNDLNCLKVNGRRLQEKEKEKIIAEVKTSSRVNMRKIIQNAIGEDIRSFQGARIDKNEKEIFHKFDCYNVMRKALEKINVDIKEFSKDDLNKIGYILTINTDRSGILEAFSESSLNLSDEIIDCLINLRKKNDSLFSKWHSFSIELMEELLPDMYKYAKEQMALLTEKGYFSSDSSALYGVRYVNVNGLCDEIYNPVLRRSVRCAINILNALMKKYDDIYEVIIKLPNDPNLNEEKKRLKKIQKSSEKELDYIKKKLANDHGVYITQKDYATQDRLNLKLRLWNEQDGKCLLSNTDINPVELLESPDKYTVVSILPEMYSYDISKNNKFLVCRSENEKRGLRTPYDYLSDGNSSISYDEFKENVLTLSRKKDYRISRNKVKNLLFNKSIYDSNVIDNFIDQNIIDNRYEAKTISRYLKGFYSTNNMSTKVEVIRGNMLFSMRYNLGLKNENPDKFAYQATDAMLLAFSRLGYQEYRKLQGSFMDFETGEILDERMWNENMNDEVYEDYLYGKKWLNIRQEIKEAEKYIKYRYTVDNNSNRGFCNQTIRGTRQYDGETYKINTLNITTKEGVATLRSILKKDKSKLLVYRYDRKTFDKLVEILNLYPDSENPFLEYEKETGNFVRKYSKNGKGTHIKKLKYIDCKVGVCIDISHKYGEEKNSQKVILESLVPFRMDVYYNKKTNKYRFVGLKQSDLCDKKGVHVLNEETYALRLVEEGILKPGQTMKNIDNSGYEFILSFYKNDVIEYEKNGEYIKERFSSKISSSSFNVIETKPIDQYKDDKRKIVSLGKTTMIRKYRTDILGNQYLCKKESFMLQ